MWRKLERHFDAEQLVMIVGFGNYEHAHPNFDSFDFVSVAALAGALVDTHPFHTGSSFYHAKVRNNAVFRLRS